MARALHRCFLLLPATALALLLTSQASAFQWLGQFGMGSATTSAGGVNAVSGIGIAPDGTVAVSDIGIDRVTVFSTAGEFISNSGKDVDVGGGTGAEVCTATCKAGEDGSAAGELNAPIGVAAAASEFYVAEAGNSRVSVFDYTGQFLRALGADVGGPGVNVCASGCGPGTQGPAGGQMAGPAGLALNAAGELLVTELGLHRVDVFDPRTGQFLRAFGKDVGGPGVHTCTTACAQGTADEAPGSVNNAFSVAVGPKGEVVVADDLTARVSVFTASGEFVRIFGGFGEEAGQLFSPIRVAVAPSGEVYVSEGPNNRFSVFGIDGTFLRAYGRDVVPGPPVSAEMCTAICKAGISDYGIGELSFPEAIATDRLGNVYVDSYARVDKWGEPPTPPQAESTEKVAEEKATTGPSNYFRFGKLRFNKKRGTARIEVIVAGAGTLRVAPGRRMKAMVPRPQAAGTVYLKLKSKRNGRKGLRRRGRLWGTIRVTFTPTGGEPNTLSKAVRLEKVKPRHRG